MKCLLLNPITRNGTKSLRVGRCQGKVIVGLWPVIEFGYIGTLLRKQGIEYRILDANHEALSFDRTIKEVISYDPDMVVILGITATLSDDLEIARRLRLAKPETYIVFIGTHATVRPGDYLKHPRDLAVIGEPEVTVAEVASAIKDGTSDLSSIQGVACFEKGQVLFAPRRPFSMDLDSIGMPDHEGMKTHTYLASDTRKPFGLIKTSKGCPYQCVFCTVHSVHGARWRYRSPQSIVEEIKYLKSRYGLEDFFFQSDVFGHKREWVVELCETILSQDLKITWFSNSRADEVDFELVSLMKRSGCKLLAFGLESFSDRVLEACKKGTTAEQNVVAIEACRKARVASLTYFVFGLPGETFETIEETKRLILEYNPDYCHLYPPTPLPGSRLYQEWGIERKVLEGKFTWAQFFQGCSARFIPDDALRREVEKALFTTYARFYLQPRRIAREVFSVRGMSNLLGKANTLKTLVKNYVLLEK